MVEGGREGVTTANTSMLSSNRNGVLQGAAASPGGGRSAAQMAGDSPRGGSSAGGGSPQPKQGSSLRIAKRRRASTCAGSQRPAPGVRSPLAARPPRQGRSLLEGHEDRRE
eukprot:8977826-Alexandrium_andersonii.AAC.1